MTFGHNSYDFRAQPLWLSSNTTVCSELSAFLLRPKNKKFFKKGFILHCKRLIINTDIENQQLTM